MCVSRVSFVTAAVLWTAFLTPRAFAQDEFIRADADSTGGVDLTDAIVTLNYLFLGATRITCLDAADSNDDGEVNVSDPWYTLNHLFLGGETFLRFPFPVPDPTRRRTSIPATRVPRGSLARCWRISTSTSSGRSATAPLP